MCWNAKLLNYSISAIWYVTQIAKLTGQTWGPPGSCRPQMGPMLAPWTLLSEKCHNFILLWLPEPVKGSALFLITTGVIRCWVSWRVAGIDTSVERNGPRDEYLATPYFVAILVLISVDCFSTGVKKHIDMVQSLSNFKLFCVNHTLAFLKQATW